METQSDKTIRIYTGPFLTAEALVGRLEDNGIFPIVRDDQQNAVMFGSGNNYTGQIRVFIREDELAAAQPLIDEFLQDLAEND